MIMKEIRHRARALRVVNYSRLNKTKLIRAVQRSEGNQECFLRISDCGQADCCWRDDCQPFTQIETPRT